MAKNKYNSITLLYHDAVINGEYDASGFPGLPASIYKLDISLMIKHFLEVDKVIKSPPGSILNIENNQEYPIYITFDDGGKSSTSLISSELNKLNWIGHFFITTDYIDRKSFVSKSEIKKLDNEGHVVAVTLVLIHTECLFAHLKRLNMNGKKAHQS